MNKMKQARAMETRRTTAGRLRRLSVSSTISSVTRREVTSYQYNEIRLSCTCRLGGAEEVKSFMQDTRLGVLTPVPPLEALAIALREDGLADVDGLPPVSGGPAVDEGVVLAVDRVVPADGVGPSQPDLLPPDTGGQAGAGQPRQEGGGGLQPGGGPGVTLYTDQYSNKAKMSDRCEISVFQNFNIHCEHSHIQTRLI